MIAHDFDAGILDVVAHRPWSLPPRPWAMSQTWHDLLFAHWPLASSRLRPHVPAVFDLDLFDGEAWVGVVPFRMTNVAPRALPALPWVSEFPELNVRTYVRVNDRPGIYFFSLDAGSAVAVTAAKTLLNLPYHAASMNVASYGDTIDYQSVRQGTRQRAQFQATYRPLAPARAAAAGSLEHFLTERYCLYNLDHRRAPYRLEIHHPPWALQPAEATFARNSMAAANGISLPADPPLLHFVKRLDMVAWLPAALDA